MTYIKQMEIWTREARREWTRMRNAEGYSTDTRAMRDCLGWSPVLAAQWRALQTNAAELAAAIFAESVKREAAR